MKLSLIDYQQRLIESDAPFTGIIGGTGSGKSYFVPAWLYTRMAQHPGHEWIVGAPTHDMLIRNPWKYIKKFLDTNKIKYYQNKSEHTIETSNGKVHFISAETPDRMQGIHPKGIIGDEAGQFSRLWWDTAVQRRSFNQGQILFATTPYKLNWLKTECYDNFLKGDKDFYFETPTSYQNPYYPIEEIKRAKARLPEWKFRMMYLGHFVKPAGLIYTDYQVVEPFEIPANWTISRGLDFGHNHPTAIPYVAESPDGTFYIISDFKQSGLTLDTLHAILKSKAADYTYGDNAQKMDIETIKARGIDIRYSDKSVLPGILFLSELFRTGRLKVFSTCKLIIDELNSYEWAIDRNEMLLDAPNKKIGNDDLLDALRYLMFTLYGRERHNISGTIETESRHEEYGNAPDPWRL